MSMLPPVGWADVATKSDLAMLRTDLLARVDRVDARIGRVEARVDVMASDLRAEMHQSIRNQTWALVTFVAALNAVLMAVCTVVVATLA